MQIYGYPGERVDFVSKSGSAGSLLFGDPRHLAEEFFGTPHTASTDEISYYSGSIVLCFEEGRLREVKIYPQNSKRERVDVYVAKQRLSGLDEETLAQTVETAGEGVQVEFADGLYSATFS